MKLPILATMMLILSCAFRSAPTEPWSVSVTSSGGIAGRGAGSYAIDSEGNVAVTSMAGKSCTFRATSEEMSRFRELLAGAHPDGWNESYVPENSCCDRFTYELTLDVADVKRSVTWIDGSLPMPKDLEALTGAMVGPEPSLRAAYSGKCQ